MAEKMAFVLYKRMAILVWTDMKARKTISENVDPRYEWATTAEDTSGSISS